MKEVVNQWNINMNTVGMAEVEEDKKQIILGFAIRLSGGKLVTKVFFDENECILAWYNACCEPGIQVGKICINVVLKHDVTEAYVARFKEEITQCILNNKLKKVSSIKLPLQKNYLTESLIWNAVAIGEEKNMIPDHDLYRYGYGLLYWENNEEKAFFDNRLAKTYAKMIELHQAKIRPIWIRISKKQNIPIPVREGGKQVLEIGKQDLVRECYEDLQDL